jgi:hypothetical protein
MTIKARVVLGPPIKLRVDTAAIVEQVTTEMHRHWQQQTRAGRQPEGGALPRNKEGQALGVGGGSLLQGWRVQFLSRSRGSTSAAAVPGSRGRQLIAIKVMMMRGVRFQGLDGQSSSAWRRIVARVLAQRIKISS